MGNNDAEGPPSWIDRKLLQEALRNAEGDSQLVVDSVIVRPALTRGENYGSDMFRATVTLRGEDKQRSVIVKTLPEGNRHEMLDRTGVFPKEMNMYAKILPQMHNILPDQRFSARCLYDGTEPTKFMVVEDLSVVGFKNASRKQGLDLVHCSMVMEHLAHFHATSIALAAQDPEGFRMYHQGVYSADPESAFIDMIKLSIRSFGEELKKFPEHYSLYGSKFVDLPEKLIRTLVQELNYKPGKFNVLIHGDLWVNNIMFKYEGDNPVALRFVDFQENTFSSPAFDLQYFLHTSLNEEVQMHHMDELLARYHSTLRDTLRMLGRGHLDFSLEQLRREFDDHYYFGIFAALSIFPVVIADNKFAEDINKSIDAVICGEEADESNRTVFTNKIYMRRMLSLLPIFEAKGGFDL